MKKIIINADDFGFSDHTVEWTIRGFECGALTSATIMAGMPATPQAIRFALKHPEFSFGVHLYLVDEFPMSDPDSIPSLIDPATGRLWSTRQFIFRNFSGQIKVDELNAEMKVQYLTIRNAGIPISHVDGHGHNHRLPQSIKALRALSCEMGFTKVRRCQDLFCARPGMLSLLINHPMQQRLQKADFRMTDHFAMNAGHSTDPHWFSHLLHHLPDGITEIGVHPGMDELWREIDIKECFSAEIPADVERSTFLQL